MHWSRRGPSGDGYDEMPLLFNAIRRRDFKDIRPFFNHLGNIIFYDYLRFYCHVFLKSYFAFEFFDNLGNKKMRK